MSLHTGVLQGVLRWSLAQGDGLAPGDARPMTEEDRRFLEEAMSSMVVDEAKRIKACIAALRLPSTADDLVRAVTDKGERESVANIVDNVFNKSAGTRSTTTTTTTTTDRDADTDTLLARVIEAQIEAFAELEDRVLTIDNAGDACKLGLLPALKSLLTPASSPALQWRAANCLATLTQNNPYCQQQAYDAWCVETVVALMQSHTSTSTSTSDRVKVLTKCLYALSSMIRDFPPSSDQLLSLGGMELLMSLLTLYASASSDDSDAVARLLTKLLSLTRYFVNTHAQCLKIALKSDLTMQLVPLIGHSDINAREETMRLLAAITQLSGTVPSNRQLVDRVQQRIDAIHALEGEEWEIAEDELQHASLVLRVDERVHASRHSQAQAATASEPQPVLALAP